MGEEGEDGEGEEELSVIPRAHISIKSPSNAVVK